MQKQSSTQIFHLITTVCWDRNRKTVSACLLLTYSLEKFTVEYIFLVTSLHSLKLVERRNFLHSVFNRLLFLFYIVSLVVQLLRAITSSKIQTRHTTYQTSNHNNITTTKYQHHTSTLSSREETTYLVLTKRIKTIFFLSCVLIFNSLLELDQFYWIKANLCAAYEIECDLNSTQLN